MFKRTEETKDKKVNVEIINKETGKTDEVFQCYFDEAERKAKAKIWGKKYFKYRIFEIIE